MIILAATEGTPLRIEADGDDAEDAVDEAGGAVREQVRRRRVKEVASDELQDASEDAIVCHSATRTSDNLQLDSMEIKKGIGVSPGVVISTAVVLDAEDLVIPKRHVDAGAGRRGDRAPRRRASPTASSS